MPISISECIVLCKAKLHESSGHEDLVRTLLSLLLADYEGPATFPLSMDLQALVALAYILREDENLVCNLLASNREILLSTSQEQPDQPTASENASSDSAERIARQDSVDNVFEESMRVNAVKTKESGRFEVIRDQLSLTNTLFADLRIARTIKKRLDNVDISFICTNAFLGSESRNKYFLEHGMSFVIKGNSQGAVGEPWEYKALKLKCNMIKGVPEGSGPRSRKKLTCDEIAFEYQYPSYGIILLYERSPESSHSHMSQSVPERLGFALKQEIKRMADNGSTLKQIKDELGGDDDKVLRRIGRAATTQGASHGSHNSGDDLNKRLKDFAQKLLGEVPDDIYFRAIKYRDATEVPHSVMTCKSWLKNAQLDTHCEDLTWIDLTGPGSSVKVIVYCARQAYGPFKSKRIKPIGIGTIDSDRLISIETFIRFLLGELATEAGFDYIKVRENGEIYFNFPNLRNFIADGQPGIDSMVLRLFGELVVRVSCYFHIFQDLERHLKGLHVDYEVTSFMEGCIRHLSIMQNVAEFMYCWEVIQCQIDKFSEDKTGHWGRLVKVSDKPLTHKSVGDLVIEYFSKNFILCPDRNRWSRALIDENNTSGRIDRSTVCEAMISKIKRMLKLLEKPSSQAHLEKLLAEKVFPKMFHDMKDIEDENIFEIPPKWWDRGNLLAEQISQFHVQILGKPLQLHHSRRYAYCYSSGLLCNLPDEDCTMKMYWEPYPTHHNQQYAQSTNHCMVFFDRTSEFHLKINSFCIITGELTPTGKIGKDWFKTAHCTCRERIDRQSEPCSHILAVYLKMCDFPEMKEMYKVTSGDDNYFKMVQQQTAVELGRDRDGYRYPNGIFNGREFISNYLVYQNGLDDKNTTPEKVQQLALLKSSYVDSMAMLNSLIGTRIVDGKSTLFWLERSAYPSLECTRLIVRLPEKGFREKVLNKHGTIIPPKKEDRENAMKRVKWSTSFLTHSTPMQEMTDFKRRKLTKKNRGLESSIDTLMTMSKKLFDSQPPKRRQK